MHQILHYFQHLERKEKFIHGIAFTVIIYIALGALLDIHTRPQHALVQGLTSFITLLLFLTYLRTRNLTLLIYGVIILLSVEFNILLYLDHFAFYSYLFPLLIPLGIFFTLPFRASILLSLLHYMGVGVTSAYGYYVLQSNSPVFNATALTVFAFASLFILSFGFIYHISIENSYKKLLASDAQKAFLLKEVHHRVKNNLNIIAAMLGLQGMESSNQEIEEIFEKNRSRVEAMAMVHELLYKQEDYDVISFKHYVETLSMHLLGMSERPIEMTLEIVPAAFPIETMQQFSIILNELITNSLKYAFAEEVLQPHICICLTQKLDFFTLDYEDNGIGCKDQDFETSNSIGSNIVSIACQQLDASMQLQYNNGFNYTIRFHYAH